ncbi:MAG: hypothetical protein ACYC7E_08725 [Armatimonadota bacterium]
MNVATGCFNSVNQAEQAFNDLVNAGFSEEDIALVVHDRLKAKTLSQDLHRDLHLGATPPADATPHDIFGQLPEEYVETIKESNLKAEAVDWYQQQLLHDNILLIVEVGNRMADADNIIRNDGGMLYIDLKRDWGQQAA